jgi:hypothetical protein
MQKTLGWTMLLVGIFILFASYAFPMATVVVDTTPPVITLLIPPTPGTGNMIAYLEAHVIDQESGISTVQCKIQGLPWGYTTYDLAYKQTIDPTTGEQRWYADIEDITTPGDYPLTWTVKNNAGLTTTVSGTFTVYTAIQGKWYVNNVEITDPTQTIYTTNPTVSFKFVKSAGISDSSITCAVWKGSTKLFDLTNSASGTWTGSYTFANGRHDLSLKASDGINTVTMSIIGLQVGAEGFQMPQLNTLQMLGLASSGIGLLLIFTGKKH